MKNFKYILLFVLVFGFVVFASFGSFGFLKNTSVAFAEEECVGGPEDCEDECQGEDCNEGECNPGDCEEEETSSVTLCKEDQNEKRLSGWTLNLNDGLEGNIEDYSGVTGENGCVTFTGVSYGSHEITEVLKEGWEHVSGAGIEVTIDSETETFIVVNKLTDDECEEDEDCDDECEDTECDEDNNGPIANAGVDQTLTLPTNSVNLDGTGTDSDGTVVSYVWTEVSGPSAVDPDDVEDPALSSLIEGVYVFKLVVTDNDGATAEDTVSITVNSENGGGGGGGGGSSGGSRRRSSGSVLGEASCGIYVDKFLRVGYENNVEQVKKVQAFLNSYMAADLELNGVYDHLTESYVNSFQLVHKDEILAPWGITEPTGIFYLTTQRKVNDIMCPDLDLPIPSNLIPFKYNPQAPGIDLGN